MRTTRYVPNHVGMPPSSMILLTCIAVKGSNRGGQPAQQCYHQALPMQQSPPSVAVVYCHCCLLPCMSHHHSHHHQGIPPPSHHHAPAVLQTTQDSVQIFSLAVLLSSMFIYNQMGSIDEAALDRLSLVTELTRHIRVRATSAPGSEDSRELGGFNPTFLWLLRGERRCVSACVAYL
jgi:hypothetical protein